MMLARARSALDEDDRLLRVVEAVARLRQDRLEGDALLVEEHEVALRLDDRRCVLEELAAGAVLRLEDAGHDRGAVTGAQVEVEVLGELVGLVTGEEGIGGDRLRVAIGPQFAGRVEQEVVEVADGGEADRIGVVEDRVVVEQPLLVAADLDRWVEHAADGLAHERLDADVGGEGPLAAPLLELDDDSVLGAGGGVAGEHGVEAAAGVAELVLEDDAVVVQLGLVEEHRERHEAVLPGRHLGGSGLVADLGDVLGAQLVRDPMQLSIGPKLLGRPGVELHTSPSGMGCNRARISDQVEPLVPCALTISLEREVRTSGRRSADRVRSPNR